MSRFSICALACAIALPAAAQTADQREDVRAVRVSVAGLDLSRPSDAKMLMRRLDRAALEACGGSVFSVRDYRNAVQNSACYRDGVRRAVAALNAPAVTSAYLDEPTIVSASN